MICPDKQLLLIPFQYKKGIEFVGISKKCYGLGFPWASLFYTKH